MAKYLTDGFTSFQRDEENPAIIRFPFLNEFMLTLFDNVL